MQTSELLQSYLVDTNTWDEMYKDASVREQYKKVVDFLQHLSVDELNKKEESSRQSHVHITLFGVTTRKCIVCLPVED